MIEDGRGHRSPRRVSLSSLTCALVAVLALITTALNSYQSDNITDMMVKGCDSFGYSRMADAFRDARASGTKPDFFIHDDQTRWLIAKFKQSGLPVGSWAEVVTTHAHHYFPGSDQVGPQYPPGTGWIMSFFPKADAVMELDQLSIILLTVGGLLLIVWCTTKGLPLSGLMMAGAVAAFLSPYEWLGGASFSINATLFPMFLGTIMACFAVNSRNRVAALFLALGAGILFGLMIQTRVASILFLPAMALIFLPQKWRLLFWYLVGFALNGIVPILLHDKIITGSFFGSTYSANDSRQELASIYENSLFYSGYLSESGAHYVFGLFLGTLLFLAAIAVTSRGRKPVWKPWLKSHYGLMASPVCAFVISVAYFLSHHVTTIYYPVPSMLLTSLLLAFAFLAIETHWQKTASVAKPSAPIRNSAAIMTAMAALLFVIFDYSSLKEIYRGIETPREQPSFTLDVPPELLQPNVWIWGDFYTSSIVYYTGHPAFKITFAHGKVRTIVYDWMKAKGDPQYIVVDSDSMKQVMKDWQALGAQFTQVGSVREAPCYKMVMP